MPGSPWEQDSPPPWTRINEEKRRVRGRGDLAASLAGCPDLSEPFLACTIMIPALQNSCENSLKPKCPEPGLVWPVEWGLAAALSPVFQG